MPVVFQEMQMLRVLGIRELVQDQAQREHKQLGFLEASLEPQVRHTKENEFLQHRMTKKATIHVGFVEGNNLPNHFKFL